MRIAVIPTIRDYAWGAPGHCMGDLVSTLLDERHEVLWFVAPIDIAHPSVQELKTRGARVAQLPPRQPTYHRFAALRGGIDTLLKGNKSICSSLEAFDPQHIYVNQGGTWCALDEDFEGFLAEKRGRYSLICHLNQSNPAFSADRLAKARGFMASAANVFFPSAWVRHLAEIQIGEAIANAEHFDYPVRFSFDRPLPWPEASVPRIAMVNRLDVHHKGIDVALEALASLHRSNVQFHLSIYGSGPDECYLKELVRYLSLETAVTFRGYTDDLKAVWTREQLLLLPSRHEGSPVAVTEAMGFGRPIVRTPYGGAAEWIEDGVNGYICAAAEVELLTATLRRALSEHARWQEMGVRAFEKIQKQRDRNPARAFLQALK